MIAEKMVTISERMLILAVLLFAAVYAPRLRCWFASLHPQTHLYNPHQNRLAIIIPARNESSVIGELLDSIVRQTYDSAHYGLFVLVKDPADPTIDLAHAAGAQVQVIPDQTCKGDALDACFQNILRTQPDAYDAYIVVDADCLLEPNFLEEMNHAMASNRPVILSKKLVKNYLSSDPKLSPMSACCNGLIWTIIDDLGNRWKSDHHVTIMTIGTGLLLRADVIRGLGGWPYRQTLTEDVELMYDCAARGLGTYYASYAKLYMEEATSLRVTNKRRTRWLTGVVDSERLYRKKLRDTCSGTVNGRRQIYYTSALRPVYAFIGFLTVFCGVELLLALLMVALRSPLSGRLFLLGLTAFGVIYLCFWILTLACIIVNYRDIGIPFRRKLALLFIHPVFYMGYIPIIARALFSENNRGWEVIERVDFTAETKEEELHHDKTGSAAGHSGL